MSQIINTNINSLNAQRNLNRSQSALQTSIQRLSSGLRINSAKDDAAGLAISERFTTQIRGLNQAIRNANDGISFAQTAEGALSTAGDALQRIRELAVQSANDTNSSSDRQALNNEAQQLIAEVNRIANSTQFNGQNILDGSLSNLVFQVGANQNQTISVTGVDARGSQLGAATDEGIVVADGDISSGLTDDLTINGVAVDLSDYSSAATVSNVINAINNVSADSNVTASKATTTSTVSAAWVTASADRTISINGVSIGIADTTTAAQAETLINNFTTQTGVTATEDGSGNMVLSNTDGSDIIFVDDGTQALYGDDETYHAGIVLSTDVGETITVAGTNDADLGIDSISAVDKALTSTSVLTRDNATEALLIVDFALQQVTGLRAELGAVQIRFESTITNLSVTTENLSGARSRIRDADFAAETANLTRTQILQQAGVAMVAQANALPQLVLSLLQ